MSSAKDDEAWTRIKSFVYAKNDAETYERYTDFADIYDDDMVTLKCTSNPELVKIVMRHFPNSENSLLLDVGAGTGMTGEALVQFGYKGKMDALEPNAALLKKAEMKSVYRKLLQIGLSPDEPLPLEGYDAIISCGAFIPNHIKARCLVPLMKALKPGGMIALDTRLTSQNDDYRKELENVLEGLTTSGQVAKVSVEEALRYGGKSPETGDVMMSKVYIYKRVN